MTDHHHRTTVDPRETTQNSVVFGKVTVTCKWGVIGEKRLDVIAAMRAFRMTGNLTFAPRCQRAIQLAQHVFGLFLKACGFFFDVHLWICTGKGAQFFDFALNLGEGFFELEVNRHLLPLGTLRFVWI